MVIWIRRLELKILRGGGAEPDAAVIPEPEPASVDGKKKKAASPGEAEPDPSAASGEADDSAALSSPARVATDSEPATVAKHVTSIQKMSDVIFPGGFQATLDGKTVKLAFKGEAKKNEFKAILSDSVKARGLAAAIKTMLNALPSGGSLEIGGVKIAKATDGAAAVQMLKSRLVSTAT